MGQVLVRNLEDRVIGALKERAKLHGNSLEQELREILTVAAKPTPAELRAISKRIRAMTPEGSQTDSVALIREERDR
jgi:plasmid stability protein